MKIQHLPAAILAATTASALPASIMARQSAPGRVLLSNGGHIYLADYTGSAFDITMTGDDAGHSPSWLAFSEPSLLYAVDESSNLTRSFNLDVAGNKLEKKAEEVGSAGVVYLEFNKERTRMVGAAYGAGTIDVWDTSPSSALSNQTILLDPTKNARTRLTLTRPSLILRDASSP